MTHFPTNKYVVAGYSSHGKFEYLAFDSDSGHPYTAARLGDATSDVNKAENWVLRDTTEYLNFMGHKVYLEHAKVYEIILREII